MYVNMLVVHNVNIVEINNAIYLTKNPGSNKNFIPICDDCKKKSKCTESYKNRRVTCPNEQYD